MPPAGAAPSMPRWSVLGLHPTAPFLVFLGAELVLNCKFPIFWCAENYPLLSIWCSQVWLSPFFGTLPGQEPPGDFRMGPHAKRNADGRRWGPAPIGGHRLKVFWRECGPGGESYKNHGLKEKGGANNPRQRQGFQVPPPKNRRGAIGGKWRAPKFHFGPHTKKVHPERPMACVGLNQGVAAPAQGGNKGNPRNGR